MDCEADDITIAGGSYQPDPAELRAVITSTGTNDSPAGDVEIVLPPELTLTGGSATQSFAAMTPGNSQTLTWQVNYPRPSVKTDYPVTFIATSAGYPSDTCRGVLTVPVLTAEQLAQHCAVFPAVIDSTTGFDPTLTVESWVRNDGNADAYGVKADITLPAQLVLGSGQNVSMPVADTLAAGDSAQVSWQVRLIGGGSHCENEQFSVDIRAYATSGAEHSCTAPVAVNYPDNLLPELTMVSPAVLDTANKGTELQFAITAYDKERATLTYKWFVDGAAEGGDTDSFAWTFDAVGDHEVKVEVYDPCSLADAVPVTQVWNFHVRSTTGIEDQPALLRELVILGNYPNPFNPGTVIEYRVPEGSHQVRLEVFDMYGRVVARLLQQEQSGGVYRVRFDAASLPSGSYVARLSAGRVTRVHRMLLMK